MAISYVCRDSEGYIIKKEGSITRDILILVTETIAIRKTLMQAINDKCSKVIIESDSLIAIQTINREFDPSKDICNLVPDIIILLRMSITFVLSFLKEL